ncbi:hypothetical protein MIND_00401900 [Mycena indigotica]|uniref:Uncharacterized protein n=1 Tax=Mycena indigotica TaxID=2126181 RepID=A0A8H6T3L7_9AGAR|nr:uncharacterized protein MIND_00401900 [Mycena indigotica]KAF7310279.1 hypothetical protein MIND_00401900 [Mycena indigotica]
MWNPPKANDLFRTSARKSAAPASGSRPVSAPTRFGFHKRLWRGPEGPDFSLKGSIAPGHIDAQLIGEFAEGKNNKALASINGAIGPGVAPIEVHWVAGQLRARIVVWDLDGHIMVTHSGPRIGTATRRVMEIPEKYQAKAQEGKGEKAEAKR